MDTVKTGGITNGKYIVTYDDDGQFRSIEFWHDLDHPGDRAAMGAFGVEVESEEGSTWLVPEDGELSNT